MSNRLEILRWRMERQMDRMSPFELMRLAEELDFTWAEVDHYRDAIIQLGRKNLLEPGEVMQLQEALGADDLVGRKMCEFVVRYFEYADLIELTV